MRNNKHELQVVQQGDNLLYDARLLHQDFKVKTKFSDWIKSKIDYGFEANVDYFASEISEAVYRGGGHNKIDYLLTLDMCKELGMLERSEIGRAIRKRFIAKEKELRGISQLPREQALFKGLKPSPVNGRKLYPYKEVLARCGYSTKSGTGQRRNRYPQHFILMGHLLLITEEFATHLYHQRQVINNRAALKEMQPVLPFNFGEPLKQGGLI